jgi:hypothetical protein
LRSFLNDPSAALCAPARALSFNTLSARASVSAAARGEVGADAIRRVRFVAGDEYRPRIAITEATA